MDWVKRRLRRFLIALGGAAVGLTLLDIFWGSAPTWVGYAAAMVGAMIAGEIYERDS